MTPRRRRGAVLLLSAAVLFVLVGDDRPLRFQWVALVTGLGYLAAAAVGGRSGDLWGPGLVVSGFGLGAVLTTGGPLGGDLFAPVVLTTVGAGAVLAQLLPKVGISVEPMSVAASVLLSGVFFLLSERRVLDLRSTLLYSGLLAAWGLWEMRPDRTSADSSAASRAPITP